MDAHVQHYSYSHLHLQIYFFSMHRKYWVQGFYLCLSTVTYCFIYWMLSSSVPAAKVAHCQRRLTGNDVSYPGTELCMRKKKSHMGMIVRREGGREGGRQRGRESVDGGWQQLFKEKTTALIIAPVLDTLWIDKIHTPEIRTSVCDREREISFLTGT